jgi:hypothetical protein
MFITRNPPGHIATLIRGMRPLSFLIDSVLIAGGSCRSRDALLALANRVGVPIRGLQELYSVWKSLAQVVCLEQPLD